jgi:hypothetical protein
LVFTKTVSAIAAVPQARTIAVAIMEREKV